MDKVGSFPRMPNFGVCDSLMSGEASELDGPSKLRIWIISHCNPDFWRLVVLRECLPSADDDLDFECLAKPYV